MTVEKYGKPCKICERAFTMFRWRPGLDARYKKTELCPTCAKLKNVCQTCVLDLDYGVPVMVRDQAMVGFEKIDAMPQSEVGMGVLTERLARDVENFGVVPYGKMNKDVENALLLRLQRRTPYYRRNMPHICTFFAKGTCNRGATCPYLHEMPKTGDLANQNIRDRFFGQNDPVARKMLGMAKDKASYKPEPPLDKTITTLWVGGLDGNSTENDLRSLFFPYGELSLIRLLPAKNCAFITFMRRDSAEEAIAAMFKDTTLRGNRLHLDWGKGQRLMPGQRPPEPLEPAPLVHNPDATLYLSVPTAPAPPTTVAPPPGVRGARPYYPSMDPKHMASKIGTD